MSKTKLWGGVFDKDIDDLAWQFGQSLDSDMTLFDEEIEVSIAHAKMLGKSGIVTIGESVQLATALSEIHKGVKKGTLTIPLDAEDLHGAVESLLLHKVGDVAKKLHSGRSRNDQIVTVTKLWLKKKGVDLQEQIDSLQRVLVNLAEPHESTVMPGYTHQQPAQPITLGYLFLAYFWMLERDKERFAAVMKLTDWCPLGSAALAGTTLPIDREFTSEELGFTKPTENALDSVSDRDFVCDALHACAMLMQHLSRISQEIVLFCTAEFGFMKLDESCSTGSSLMPQKRNPDFAELIRGRSSRAIGNWTTVMVTMKALPLGYNRDQQEDKPPLFDSVKLCQDSLKLIETMLQTATFDVTRMSKQAEVGYPTATAVAEAIVKQGVPFREAHELVGMWVKTCLATGQSLDAIKPGNPMEESALAEASVHASIEGRGSLGATSKSAFAHQLAQAHVALKTPNPQTS